MASQGSGRRQPRCVLPELPLPWSFCRQPDGEARRRAGGVGAPRLFGGRFNETERLRVVLLPLFLGGRGCWHQLALDVAGFSAEELTVTLEGRQLTVAGKQEKEAAGGDGSVCRERRQVRQELLLPPDADLEALTCALGHDGQLHLRAPRLERIIPVTRGEEVPVHPSAPFRLIVMGRGSFCR
uniref:SHSP domain-containing protein n=1 Tax=Naja naja TaxID=35670 RepID=A0A8C6XNS0_NAJNA